MLRQYIEQATPRTLAGFCGLLQWAERYGHEMVGSVAPDVQLLLQGSAPVEIELSSALSASFNPGFGSDENVYLMVTTEEYEWLSLLPINEVVVSDSSVCIVCRGIKEGSFEIAMMAMRVCTDQPKLWASMRGRSSIHFGCVQHNDTDYEVSEYMQESVPLRFLNS